MVTPSPSRMTNSSPVTSAVLSLPVTSTFSTVNTRSVSSPARMRSGWWRVIVLRAWTNTCSRTESLPSRSTFSAMLTLCGSSGTGPVPGGSGVLGLVGLIEGTPPPVGNGRSRVGASGGGEGRPGGPDGWVRPKSTPPDSVAAATAAPHFANTPRRIVQCPYAHRQSGGIWPDSSERWGNTGR